MQHHGRARAERAYVPVAVLLGMHCAGIAGAWAQNAPAEALSPNHRAEAEQAVVNSVGMRLVRVAPGVFTMGSELDEPMRQEEEVPRTIRLTKAFRISATEVTNAQWRAVMGSGSTPGRADDYPVVEVSWKDASEFCRRLSAQEDRSYRLPTEAEWEYACRAGTRSGPPGPVELDAAAWYDANSDGAAQPVGRRAPTVWGLHDMLGNVMEWCSDYYGPYDQRVSTDPIGPADGRARVARGGSWRHFRPACRCAARIGLPESYQLGYVGFRVILDATE